MPETIDLPSSLSQAKLLGAKRFFTGKPCGRGHVSERVTPSGCCYSCQLENVAAWKKANPEAAALQSRKSAKLWREKNPERRRAYEDRTRSHNNEMARKWAKLNRARLNSAAARRRAQKLNATPSWLTAQHHNEIQQVYQAARDLTKATGVRHHVDHIVPLQGRNVCGLHVPWNLQVLTMTENQSKGNRHGEF